VCKNNIKEAGEKRSCKLINNRDSGIKDDQMKKKAMIDHNRNLGLVDD
jgi:hypothetical protein